MKKFIASLVVLAVIAGFVLNAAYPYYKAFLMDGQVKSIEYNDTTQVAECIMVNEKTGKIVEFKTTGKRWKIVEVDTCIQVKMYPSIFPTESGAFKMVNLEKILDCSSRAADTDSSAEVEEVADPAVQPASEPVVEETEDQN